MSTVRYIYQVLRGIPPEQVFAQTLLGFETVQATMDAHDNTFVGINFVMPEDGFISMHDYTLQMKMVEYLHSAFPKVHITLHAGEIVPGMVPPEGLRFHIRQAVDLGHAERIGHGVDVMYEDNAHGLLQDMAKSTSWSRSTSAPTKAFWALTAISIRSPSTAPPMCPSRSPPTMKASAASTSPTNTCAPPSTTTSPIADLKQLARTGMEHNFLPGASLWASPDVFTIAAEPCRAQPSARPNLRRLQVLPRRQPESRRPVGAGAPLPRFRISVLAMQFPADPARPSPPPQHARCTASLAESSCPTATWSGMLHPMASHILQRAGSAPRAFLHIWVSHRERWPSFFAIALVSISSTITAPLRHPVPPVVHIDGLGKGAAPLDGDWQFHLATIPPGTSPASTTAPATADGRPLPPTDPGAHRPCELCGLWLVSQRHPHHSAPGASPDVALMIPPSTMPTSSIGTASAWEALALSSAYGLLFHFSATTYGLGPVRSGVLAFRVYKVPLASNDDGTAGGFEGPPYLGSPQAIAAAKTVADYRWLSRGQSQFALTTLYALTSLLSLVVWLRNRRQWLLFWMMTFTFMPVLELVLNTMRLPVSAIWLTFFIQTVIQLREVSQWFLLLWLLELHNNTRLVHWIRIIAVLTTLGGICDGALGFLIGAVQGTNFQLADAVLTAVILPGEAIPVLLAIYAVVLRKRLDSARWLVAGFAILSGTFYAISNVAAQGVRFTHWTLAANMNSLHITLLGSQFSAQMILRTLLFLAIVYAVARYAMEDRRRRAALELEFENAREIQQVLVPESCPPSPASPSPVPTNRPSRSAETSSRSFHSTIIPP